MLMESCIQIATNTVIKLTASSAAGVIAKALEIGAVNGSRTTEKNPGTNSNNHPKAYRKLSRDLRAKKYTNPTKKALVKVKPVICIEDVLIRII
jgi:hypothetical protein